MADREAGDGDVRIKPATETLSRGDRAHSPSGHAPSRPLGEMADFLDRTYDVVVPATSTSGSNVDQALTHLISTMS